MVYGAGGKAGGAVARVFACEVSADIRSSGGSAEVTNVAAFVASDRTGAMTGTVATISSGSIID